MSEANKLCGAYTLARIIQDRSGEHPTLVERITRVWDDALLALSSGQGVAQVRDHLRAQIRALDSSTAEDTRLQELYNSVINSDDAYFHGLVLSSREQIYAALMPPLVKTTMGIEGPTQLVTYRNPERPLDSVRYVIKHNLNVTEKRCNLLYSAVSRMFTNNLCFGFYVPSCNSLEIFSNDNAENDARGIMEFNAGHWMNTRLKDLWLGDSIAANQLKTYLRNKEPYLLQVLEERLNIIFNHDLTE